MPHTNKIIHIEDNFAKDALGAIVYWSLSGDTDLDKLTKGWIRNGLDEKWLPSPTSGRVAMQRACNDAKDTKIFPRRTKDGRWIMVRQIERDNEISFETLCSVFLDGKDLRVYRSQSTTNCTSIVNKVIQNFHEHLGRVTSSDVGTWLVNLASDRCGCTPLRPRGGIYFVPRNKTALWRRVCKALRYCSDHMIYELAAMRSEEAVEAILAAIRREVHSTIQNVQDELRDEDKELGARALQSRKKLCSDLLKKVEHYAELLDTNLDELEGGVENLQSRVTQLQYAAEAKKENRE